MAVAAPCPLTPREFEVLCSLADGLTYKQIALRDGVSCSTVRTQMHGAMLRLEVSNALQAVLACQRAGWLDRDLADAPSSAVLADVEFMLGELVAAVREHGVGGLTPAQRSYLAAFDDHLYARLVELVASSVEAHNDRMAEPRSGDA